jgi:hypothetical protein
MPRNRIIAVVCVSALAVALVSAPSGQAHYWTATENWYFEGKTRHKDNFSTSDPVNFMFMQGSADHSPYTRTRIEQHMKDDWKSVPGFGGRPWRKDSEILSKCRSDQRMTWVNHGSTNITSNDVTDWQGATTVPPGCGPQHHARFWDDFEHDRDTNNHGDRHQWVLGSIHHENLNATADFPPVKHEIDRDWDLVRVDVTKAMAEHCRLKQWAHHTDAVLDKDAGQGFTNSGFIARLSLQHATGGCTGYLTD